MMGDQDEKIDRMLRSAVAKEPRLKLGNSLWPRLREHLHPLQPAPSPRQEWAVAAALSLILYAGAWGGMAWMAGRGEAEVLSPMSMGFPQTQAALMLTEVDGTNSWRAPGAILESEGSFGGTMR